MKKSNRKLRTRNKIKRVNKNRLRLSIFRSSKNIYAYPTKSKAESEAKKLGCVGVHKMGQLWMPCATHINPN